MSLSVYTIDCNYVEKEVACAYLMVEGKEAAFIENNTNQAIPFLLEELNKHSIQTSDVKYLIVTHIHLDHSGGTSGLLKHCRNAIVLAHPKAATHLINPSRLIDSASKVYGEENFKKLYGEIEPIPQEKVRIMNDGEELIFGDRTLKFIYTRGHANHHFVIYDSKTKGVFTGDSFGVGYPSLQKGTKPFLFPSTTPTDFDHDEAILSLEKILNTGAEKAYLTHFGEWTDLPLGYIQLKKGLDYFQKSLLSAVDSKSEDELQNYFINENLEFFRAELKERGIEEELEKFVQFDIDINAQGLAFAAKRMKKKKVI
ncbi:MAG: MBL fold metallo-hydrolase [Leptospiraceae bacterium]|nr:MBL fold metallo-hydrolase [Leptospiraceae bacterium]